MSSSERRRNVESGEEAAAAHEHLSQERLQILLHRLGWSYAALWTLNPQTRVLEWKRGHFQVDTTAGTTTTTSQPKVWYAQQFYTTYRSCSFVPGAGFVGRAYIEGRHIWLLGDLVCQNAGSLQQSQFLRDASIKTVMCIPWLDSVLELGTNLVGETFESMDRIQQVMSHDLLSILEDNDDADLSGLIVSRELQTVNTSSPAVAPAIRTLTFHQNSSQNPTNWAPLQSPKSLGAMSTLPLPDQAAAAALNQSKSPFQSAFDNQVWRSDVFMEGQGKQHPGIAAAWSRAVKGIIAEQSTSHGLMISQADGQYGACPDSFGSTTAATTSSSNGNSQAENSSSSAARPASAAASPDQLLQQYHLHALSPSLLSGSAESDRTSSSVRMAHGPHLEAELAYLKQSTHSGPRTTLNSNHSNLRRTTSCSDQYEIQKALSLLEAQEIRSDQWRQLQAAAGLQRNPASTSDNHLQQPEFSFHSWQQDEAQRNMVNPNSSSHQTGLIMRSNYMKSSRPLLRRHTLSAMEVLKEVETYHDDIQADQAASNVSYELHEDFKAFDQPAHVEINTPRFRPGRSRMSTSNNGAAGALHASHSEAATNHMLAERRRRVKQKENFATLRRLVPIISKADKASTLVDAIAYLKDLQNTIVHMEARKEDMDQRCENLVRKCMELEEQNKGLVAILSKGKLDSSAGPFNHLLKLQSMKSI